MPSFGTVSGHKEALLGINQAGLLFGMLGLLLDGLLRLTNSLRGDEFLKLTIE